MPDFWDDDLLDTHPDWEILRAMSKEVLRLMKLDNLKLKIERSTKTSPSLKGELLTIEWKKILLVK